MKPLSSSRYFIITAIVLLIIYSCSKGSGGGAGGGTPPPPPPDPCAGVTIVVTGTTTNPTIAGGTNGSIAATAAGSGITFNINGGAFQASGTFSNLAAGSYTIVAKNASGCTGSAIFTLTAPNACAGITITVANTSTGTIPCEATSSGTITAAANGGGGSFTYSINGGTFQASNLFSNLAAGNYTVTAKDVNGCTGTSALTTINNAAEGPLFSAVRTLVQNNCVTCHNPTVLNGGMNWTVDCNIVTFKDRIKARAVDGNPSPMPEGGFLPLSERQKITDWINAGGKYTN